MIDQAGKKIITGIKLSYKINDHLNKIVKDRLHLTTGEYTSLLKTYKNHHTQSQEKKVSKNFQKNCLNRTILSDHNASELEINNKNVSGKQNQKSYIFGNIF